MDKPYELQIIDSPESALMLANWFREQAGGVPEPFGIGLKGKGRIPKVGLAQGKQVALIQQDPTGLIKDIIETAIAGGDPPLFLSRSVEDDLVRLSRWMKPSHTAFDRLAGQFCGDLTGASHVSGLPLTPRDKFKTAADDAFDVSMMEPQYRAECTRYYQVISLPLARLRAERKVFPPKGSPQWRVSYDNLWLRILVHLTGDPTIKWALNEDRDPFEVVSRMLEAPLEATKALLVWQALGRDAKAVVQHFPEMAETLPDDLPTWARQFDKHLPTLSYGITTTMDAYQQNRIVRTLYGRRLPGGLVPSAACHHVVFGSVLDMLEVAIVTLWNNRPDCDTIIEEAKGSLLEESHRINGYGPKEDMNEWVKTVASLSPLANPLGTDNQLRPGVVIF